MLVLGKQTTPIAQFAARHLRLYVECMGRLWRLLHCLFGCRARWWKAGGVLFGEFFVKNGGKTRWNSRCSILWKLENHIIFIYLLWKLENNIIIFQTFPNLHWFASMAVLLHILIHSIYRRAHGLPPPREQHRAWIHCKNQCKWHIGACQYIVPCFLFPIAWKRSSMELRSFFLGSYLECQSFSLQSKARRITVP